MNKRISIGLLCTAIAASAFATGCENTAINKDAKTTFLDTHDMVTMTNEMAQSIIADPRVQEAWRAGALKVVIKR